jgi:lysophospholipase L1-like esterase
LKPQAGGDGVKLLANDVAKPQSDGDGGFSFGEFARASPSPGAPRACYLERSTIEFLMEDDDSVPKFSNISPPTSPVNRRTAVQPGGGALRRYAPRLLLALAASLGTLKLADVVFGGLANSRQRHLLRLAPESQVRHKSREFDYVFKTNRLGLRGADVPFKKPPGTFRIVVMGDSFVAGYGVADESLMTKLLEEKIAAEHLSKAAGSTSDQSMVEVVNVGRVGTSTIREFDIYETLGRRFKPDLVILAYYLGNDLAEVVQEQTHAELAGWHPDGWVRRTAFFTFPNLYLELAMIRQSRQQLREFAQRDEAEIVEDIKREARARGRDPAGAAANYSSLSPQIRRDVAAGLLAEQRIVDSCIEPDRLVRALDPDDDVFQHAWGRAQVHLDLLRRAVERDGARLVVVAIPAPFQLDRKSLEFHKALGYEVREDWLSHAESTGAESTGADSTHADSARAGSQTINPPRTREPRTAVSLAEWARRGQVPYLDLTDRLDARIRTLRRPLYFVEDVHWNEEGNAAGAEAIADFLLNRKLCP